MYRHSLSILARGAKGEVSATSVQIRRPQKNHPHSYCHHDDHDSGDRHHTLRLRHVLDTKDRHNAPHPDSAECADDEEGEEHAEGGVHGRCRRVFAMLLPRSCRPYSCLRAQRTDVRNSTALVMWSWQPSPSQQSCRRVPQLLDPLRRTGSLRRLRARRDVPFVADRSPQIEPRDGLLAENADRSHHGLPSSGGLDGGHAFGDYSSRQLPESNAKEPVPRARQPDLPKRAGVTPATIWLVQPEQSLSFFTVFHQEA